MTSSPELIEQLQRMSAGAGLCDVSRRTQVEVSGADAVRFLNSFCTQDVNRLDVGTGGEAFFCDPRGKTIGHGFIYRLADTIVIESAPEQASVLMEHLDRYIITEDVELHDRRGDWGLLAVIGARADACLADALKLSPPSDSLSTVLASTDLTSSTLEVRSTLAYGDRSFHLRCSADEVESLQKQLESWGARPLDPTVLELTRIANGAPLFGLDITPNNLPQEIGRDDAISFTKGCYLGQETVARIDARGHVNWMLVGIRGPADLRTGAELRFDEKPVGDVRSCVPHPTEDGVLGLALVRRERAKGAEPLESDAGPVTLAPLPQSLNV